MANGKNLTNWNEITSQEAFRLSQAEFKGMMLQAVQDLQSDIREIKQDRDIKGYINYGVSALIGAIAGLFGAGMHK